MKKLIYLILLFNMLAVSYTANSKHLSFSGESELLIVEYKNIVYLCSDSIYQFTLFIDSAGNYEFSIGHSDSTLNLVKFSIFAKDQKNQTHHYMLSYHFNNLTDTIDGTNLIHSHRSSWIEGSVSENLLFSVRFAYIQKKLGSEDLTNSDLNFIRLIYPNEQTRRSKVRHTFIYNPLIQADSIYVIEDLRYFNCVEIKFIDDSIWISKIEGVSSDYYGMKINKIDSTRFKSSDQKVFLNMIHDSSLVISSNCITPNDSWMIDYNCFSVRGSSIASDRCLKRNKGFETISNFVYLVRSMGSKYLFKDNKRF